MLQLYGHRRSDSSADPIIYRQLAVLRWVILLANRMIDPNKAATALRQYGNNRVKTGMGVRASYQHSCTVHTIKNVSFEWQIQNRSLQIVDVRISVLLIGVLYAKG